MKLRATVPIYLAVLGLTVLGQCALVAAGLGIATPAFAKHRGFRFFPQDLDMERPGTGELSMRLGLAPHGAPLLAVPDFELDLGLLRRLELGIDGQWGLATSGDSWGATDQVWLSLKHLLIDDRLHGTAIAVGLQHGPRVAAMLGTSGIGYEAMALCGLRRNAWQLLLTLGGGIDPHDEALGQRPWVALGGIDVDWFASDAWSIEGQVLDMQGPGATGWVESLGVAWQSGAMQLRGGATTAYAGTLWAPGVYVGFSRKLSMR